MLSTRRNNHGSVTFGFLVWLVLLGIAAAIAFQSSGDARVVGLGAFGALIVVPPTILITSAFAVKSVRKWFKEQAEAEPSDRDGARSAGAPAHDEGRLAEGGHTADRPRSALEDGA